MSKKLLAGLAPLVATAVIAAMPSTALANVHVYCDQTLEVGGTCPPNGESKWWHLNLNQAWDPYGEHESCIDEYLDGHDNPHYTEQSCKNSDVEPVRQYPEGEWGYPRAWNGGSISHLVEATEEGE
jgi:hypothetical protein